MKKEKVIALCSGGFDSIVLLNDLARNPMYDVTALFFDYGQANVKQESMSVDYWCNRLSVPCIKLTLPHFKWGSSTLTTGDTPDDYTDLDSQYVPMRNLIFASYALSYAESVKAKYIYMAILGGGAYPDTTEDFIVSLNEIAGDVGISFVTPYISHDKVFLVSRAWEYGIITLDENKSLKPMFFSCNTPVNGKACGKCLDCLIISEMFFNKPLDDKPSL